MPSADLLIAFLLATSVFAYMPGPAMVYATAQTLAGGARAGWLAALGLHIGGYVHVLAAAFGLALVFQAVPTLYIVVKTCGAAYLIWLGLTMWRRPKPLAPHDPAPKPQNAPFWHSVSVEVLNPKSALFFLAFLPQFTDPAAALPIWAQLLILGTIVNVMFSSADAICIVLASRITSTLRQSPTTRQITQKLGGSILIALGVKLGLTQT